MNNKAQITIVLIIAILIVLISSIAIYLFLSSQEKISIPEIKAVAEGAKPVSNYVTSCLKTTTEDALNLIGSQGGFLDTTNLKTDIIQPTKGEAVKMAVDSDAVIPYWYYLASENRCEKAQNCVFVKQVPSEKQIKNNLEQSIKENLDNCLKNFQGIKNFQIIPEGDKDVKVYITKDSVQTLLKYKLKIKTDNQEFQTNEYLASVNLNLKKILELAAEITELEIENKFLEGHALNLISIYSDMDSDKLPPIGKTEISFKGSLWIKSLLKEKIKQELLAPNMQFLRTAYINLDSGEGKLQNIVLDIDFEEIDEETINTLLNRGMVIPLENDYTNLHTTFSYLPWWDIYFDLNCDNELCGPQEANINYLAIFGIQRYQFAYDLSYPVLIEITDPTAMGNKGYVFKFLLETNIRNNEKLESDTEILPSFNIEDARTMLCDQKTSGEYTINVKNGLRGIQEPVNDAPVNFICGAEKCDIGEINNGILKTKLPRCLNARLEITKQGFNPTTTSLNTFTDRKNTLDLKLEPYRKCNVDIKKYPLLKTGEQGTWMFNPTLSSLEDKEEAVITINKKVFPGEQGHSTIANIVGNKNTLTNPCDNSPKNEITKIELVPGIYEVNIMIISYNNMTIPAERREAGTWPMEKKYTVPEMSFNCDNPLPVGQIKFDWKVESKDLDTNKFIEFHAVTADFENTPKLWRKLEDLTVTSDTQKYTNLYKTLIEPRWKRR